jgi:hypothetical protein
MRTSFGALVLGISIAVTLAGCTQAPPASPTATTDKGATPAVDVTSTAGEQVTSLPATAAPPPTTPTQPASATQPPAPTPVPTPAFPTATLSPAASLLGPEWTVAALGDANLDGRIDVIGYMPASIAARQPSPDYPLVASQVVIVQQNDFGQPELQFAANSQQILVPGQTLAAFPEAVRPAAYMLRVAPGSGQPLALAPISASGDLITLPGGFAWDFGAGRYVLVAAPAVPGTPTGAIALVGSEWTVGAQGDFNSNSRRDIVAYKPSGIVPQQPNASLPLAISEAVIVEEGPLGRSELQLAANSQQILVPGATLATFPGGAQPAAFQAAVAPGGVVLNLVPLWNDGRALAPGGRIVWDAAAQGYRLTADSNVLPQPRALLGPEWTVLADGDANFDGRRDVIAFKPAGIAPRPPSPDFRYVASEIVIVQENAASPFLSPEVQLAINTRQAIAPGLTLASYPSGAPEQSVSAFQLRLLPGTTTPVSIIPINNQGSSFTSLAASAYWNGAAGGYRLQPLALPPTQAPLPPTATVGVPVQPTAMPPATATPPTGDGSLVGPEWTIMAQGDINADGRRDVAAYQPATVALSGARYPDLTIQQVAREMVVVQAGASGQPELLLGISPSQVIVPGQTLFSFNPPAAAFLIGLRVSQGADTALIRFTPLGANGSPIGAPVTMVWDPSLTLYVPQQAPQPRDEAPDSATSLPSLMGEGWRRAAGGDVNGDGIPDEVAYRPAATQPAQPDGARPLAAAEIVVAQRNADGTILQLLQVAPQAVRVPNLTLIDYANPPQNIAGFQFAVDSASLAVTLAPYDASGAPVGQVVSLVWNADQKGYRLAPGR